MLYDYSMQERLIKQIKMLNDSMKVVSRKLDKIDKLDKLDVVEVPREVHHHHDSRTDITKGTSRNIPKKKETEMFIPTLEAPKASTKTMTTSSKKVDVNIADLANKLKDVQKGDG